MSKSTPTYPLTRVQDLVMLGRRLITGRAGRDAWELFNFDETDIEECVQQLSTSDFDKSDPSETVPGLWHDVYKPTYLGTMIYVKVQIIDMHAPKEQAVIISFHRP